MKKAVRLLLIWLCACLPQWASAHEYHEFSHAVPPIVQGQILDVLDKVLEKTPRSTNAKIAAQNTTPSSLIERLLERMDIGSVTTTRVLTKEFEVSPLAKTFAPMGLPIFIEELVLMTDEYHEHGKAGATTFLTSGSISRIRAIEVGLEKAKK